MKIRVSYKSLLSKSINVEHHGSSQTRLIDLNYFGFNLSNILLYRIFTCEKFVIILILAKKKISEKRLFSGFRAFTSECPNYF